MVLKRCISCGDQISSNALSCPQCGDTDPHGQNIEVVEGFFPNVFAIIRDLIFNPILALVTHPISLCILAVYYIIKFTSE